MIDFGAIFSQVWFLIPIFIFVAIIKILFEKKGKKRPYNKYKNNKHSKTKKEEEIPNTIYEDVSKHNKEYFHPTKEKDFEQDLKNSEIKYKNKYEEKKEKVFTNNETLNNKMSLKEKKEKGDELERRAGEHYEKKGYIVKYNGIDKNREDGGIDLICINNDEILLIQCKNWSKDSTWKIRHTNVKAFHSDCIKYTEEMKLDRNKVKLKYIVSDKKIIHNSALNIFKDDYYCCRYEVI